MEIIQGRRSPSIDASRLTRLVADSTRVLIDLGAGDGRFVREAALADPSLFAIGVDACRDCLRPQAHRVPANAVYVIANVATLPAALDGAATMVTLNFPWGSLLGGLLAGNEITAALGRITRPGARIAARLNAGALAEQGFELETGIERVQQTLHAAGFVTRQPVRWGHAELRRFPSSWAKRLAFGRDPRAVELCAIKRATAYELKEEQS